MNHTCIPRRAARLLPPVLGLLAASLLAVAAAVSLLAFWHSRQQLALLDGFCTALVARAPQSADAVYALAKEGNFAAPGTPGVLSALGYRPGDFADGTGALYAAAAAGFGVGAALFAAALLAVHRRADRQRRQLIALLDAARSGRPLPLLDRPDAPAEGSAAQLGDEIEKTVTQLTLTREAAVKARDRFAQNLADIAHQLKTPLTALGLAAQQAGPTVHRAMAPQLDRLTRLEESLLLLARLDAGTLPLRAEPADLFTLLTLAADNLQPLADRTGVTLAVAEQGAVTVRADPDWTMEALLNLMKNCVEHAPAGSTVHCSYRQNPLYAQVVIQDQGAGFAPADLPHLFERFYRGQNARPDSTGIGLAIAKELLERQKALLTAGNAPEGGGRFEVRFYG